MGAYIDLFYLKQGQVHNSGAATTLREEIVPMQLKLLRILNDVKILYQYKKN